MSGSEEAALLRWAHETGVDLDQLTHPGITVKELEGTEREKLVRVFVRHLLLALNRLHEQGVAHLDLRPESILLNDNRLKLADFGQSRRLDHGFITGSIKGSPEFVSPEVVMGRPLTLATDIWSVGTLTCILLTGVSPFHGDNDNETLRNVSKGLFRTDTEEWDDFTDDAKDFVYALLQMDPRRRPNCGQALSLPWLRDEEVSMAPLSADCLREFKYKHKWLERRVFVQQSPSEQLLELLKHPPTNVAERGHPPAEGEPIGAPRPIDIYDYWRQQRGHPGHPGHPGPQGQQGHPQHPGHPGHQGHPGQPQHPSHHYPNDPRGHPQGPPHRHPQRFDENGNPLEERGRGQSPHHPPYQVDHLGRPIDPYGLPINYRPDAPQDQWGRQRHDRHPPPPSPGQAPIPVDQYGRFVHPEELARIQQQQGYGRQQQRPQDIPLDQYGRPIVDPRRQPVDQYGRPIPPELLRRLQQRPEDLTRPPPPYHPHHSPMGERRRLEPQEKGEAPSTERFPTPEQPLRRPEDNPLAQVPIRMIRGEHREIEEEIANRILSDISEEGSLAGSVASIDELEPYYSVRDYREQRRRARYSPDSTPQLEDNSSDEDSSPTLSPKTVKESETFFAASPTSGLISPPEAVSPAPERVEEPEREQRKEELLEKQKEEDKEAAKEITPPIDVRRPEFTPEKATSSPETVRYISDREESPISPKKFVEEEKKPADQQILDLKPKSVDEISPSANKENMEKRKEDMKDVEDLDKFQTEILKEADANPNIPVGAPLFLEALERHHPFLISQSLTVDIPKDGTLSPVSPKTPRTRPRAKSAGGTGMKSPIVMSPGKEHSMEVLIATKRGKPEFIPPGEEVPELDDPEARSRDRQKKIQPGVHGPEDDFQDKQDELEKIKRTIKERKAMIDDLDKYRPKNFYKEEEANGGPDYDIDDSPWDSHYQIGPDTYLMASRGASFNSRVRDYRRELWGQGAPLVNQGYLGYRNRDITVRERRRYTDILREQQMQLEPKSSEHGTTLGKDPKNNAISRIKADIDKVAPAATKKNQDGTFAPIFAGRLRDVYLNAGSPSAVFECNVISSPAANVSWTKHGKELCEDGRHKFSQENGIARLTILQPSVYDLGEYVCTAANEYGQDKTACRMISGEAPNRPGRPNMELSSDTELFMTFEPPEGPTYLEGITYKLEYRMAGENDYGAPWVVVSANVDDEAIVIKHLEPLGTYQFRVTAKNGFGWGEPSLNSRIVRTHPRGSPKLQLEELSRTCRYNTVAMPQSKAAQKSLEGISEESEDMEEEEESGKKQTEVQLESGDFSGRFQLESVLFCTKYSVLRNAVDKQNETSCVAKIRHCPSDSSSQKEYETLQKGQHENVQTLLAAHLHSDFLHLFCERLYEDVFARFCFNDSYTEEQISMVSRQMAAALHWLHFRGIIHGDVNPHNVMFASKRSWIVKICDFSSAQFAGPEAKAPSDPDVQWAPPEYHTEGMPVTVQADIWGMGVVVFCLLGGFHPFTSEFDAPDEVKENVLNVKCDPNLIPVQASQEALSYVTWALKKSPIRRMRTDEALTHRFLSADPSAVRRREAIKYYSSRLRKTAQLTKQCFETPQSSELASKYGNAQ